MEPSEQPSDSGDLIVSPTSPEVSVGGEFQNIVEVTSEEYIGDISEGSTALILSPDTTIELTGKLLVLCEEQTGDGELIILNKDDIHSLHINTGLEPNNYELIRFEDGREIMVTHNPLCNAKASSESGYSTSSNPPLESLNVSHQVQLDGDTAGILFFTSTSESVPSEETKEETKDETKHDKLLQLAVVAQDLQTTDLKNSESVNMACMSDLGNGYVPDSVSISLSKDASAITTYHVKEKEQKDVFCQENAPYQADISTLNKKEISSLSASEFQMTIVNAVSVINAVTSVRDQNFEKTSESNGCTKERRIEENNFDKNHIEKIEELGKISSVILINENYVEHSNKEEITDCKLSNEVEKNISSDYSKTTKSSFDKNHIENMNESDEISSVILTNENYMQHSKKGEITDCKLYNKSEISVPSNHPNSEKSSFDKHFKKVDESSKISSLLLKNENDVEHSNMEEVTNYMLSNESENSVSSDCLNSMKEVNQSLLCGKKESFTIESNRIVELSSKEDSNSETCIDNDEKIDIDICDSVDFPHKLSSNENMCEGELKHESSTLSNDMNKVIDTNINEDLYTKNGAFVSKNESKMRYSEIVETMEINSGSETATPSLKENSNSKDSFNKNKRKCVIDEYEFQNSSSTLSRKISLSSSLENQCTEILNSAGDISTEIDVTKFSQCTYSENKSRVQNLSFRGALTLVNKKNYDTYGVDEKIHNEIDKKVIQDDTDDKKNYDNDEKRNYDVDEKINQDSIGVEISLSSVNNEIKLTIPNEVNHYNISNEINKDSNDNEIHHNCVGREIIEDSTDSEINKNSLDNKMSEDSVDERVSEDGVDKINENSVDDKIEENSSEAQIKDSIESNEKEVSTDCKISEGSVDCERNEVGADCVMNEDGANCNMNESYADGELNEGSTDWEMNESSTDSKINHNSDGKRNKRRANREIIEDSADGRINEDSADGKMNQNSADGRMNQDRANSKENKDNDHSINQTKADAKMIESNADSKIKQDNADDKINYVNDCKMNQDSADDKMNVDNVDSKTNKYSADGKINEYHDCKMNWDGTDKITESKINQHIDVKTNQSCVDEEANESNVDCKMNQHNEDGKINGDNVYKMNWDSAVYKMNESNADSEVNKDSDIRRNQDSNVEMNQDSNVEMNHDSFDSKMNQDSADGKMSDGEMNEEDTDGEVDEGSADAEVDEGSADAEADEGSADAEADEGSADGETDEGNADNKVNHDTIDSKMNEGSVDDEMDEGSVDDEMDEGSVDDEMNEGSVDNEVDEGSLDDEVNEVSGDEDVNEGSVDDEEVNEVSVDEEVNEGSVDDEVNKGSVDDEVNEVSGDEEVNEGSVDDEEVNEVSVDDEVNEVSVDEEVNEGSVDDEMDEGSVDDEMDEGSVDDEVNEGSVDDEEVNEGSVDDELNESSVDNEVNEVSVDDEVNEVSVDDEVNEVSVDDEVNEVSVAEEEVNKGSVDEEVNEGSVDEEEVNEGSVDEEVNEGSVDEEVNEGSVDDEVNEGSIDEEVNEGSVDDELNEGSVDNEVNEGSVEVNEGSVDEVNEDSVDEVNEFCVDDEEVNEGSVDVEVNEGSADCKMNSGIADNKTDVNCADGKMNENSDYSKQSQSAYDKITESQFNHKMNKDNAGKMNQDSADGKINKDRAYDKVNHINMENVADCGSMDDEINFSIMKDQNVGDKINGVNVGNKNNHAAVSGIINQDSLDNKTKCSNVMNEINDICVGVKRNHTENELNKSIENYNNSSILFEDFDDERIFNGRNKRASYLAAIQKANFEEGKEVNKNESVRTNMLGMTYDENMNSDEKIGSTISNSAVFDKMSYQSTETIFNMDLLASDLMIPEGTSVQPPERTYVRKKPSSMVRKTKDIGLFSNDELSDSSYSSLREDNSKESTKEDVKHLNSETVEDEDYLIASNVEGKVIATYKNKRRSSQRCIKKKIRTMKLRSDLNLQKLEPKFVEDPETAGWGAYLLGASFKPTNTEDVPETPSINVEQEKVPEKPIKKTCRPWFKSNSHKTRYQWAKMIKSSQPKFKATPSYKKKIEQKVKKQVENLCKSENLDKMPTPVQSSKKKKFKVVRHVKAHTSSQSSPTSEEVKVCHIKVLKSYINENYIPVGQKESERKSFERRGFSESQNSNNYKYSCQYCDYGSNVLNNIFFHSKFCLSGLQGDVIYLNNQSFDVINNMEARQRIRGEDFYRQLIESPEEMGESSESLSNASAVETLDDEEPDYSFVYQDGMKKKIDEAELRRQTKTEKVKKYGFADSDVIWAKVKHRFWPAIVWKIDEIETIIYLIGYPSKYVGLHLRTDSLKGQWRSFHDAKWNRKILEDAVRYKDNDKFVKAVQKCDSYTRKIFLDDVDIDPFDYFNFPRNRMLFMPEDVRNEAEEPLVPLEPQEMKELEMDELDTDNEKIMSCILDGCCDDHLVSVYQKEVSSERQEMFFNRDKGCSSRLKNMSWFAPFIKDPAMQTKLSDYFFDVFRSRIGDLDDMTPYINEVWIPEAIIKAISIVRNLDMDDAEDVFCKQGTENGISDIFEPMDVEETD